MGVEAGGHREFHIREDVRREYGVDKTLFSLSGNVVLADFRAVREFAARVNRENQRRGLRQTMRAGELAAMGLIDEILHYMVRLYRTRVQRDVFDTALGLFNKRFGGEKTAALLGTFCGTFPPQKVYSGEESVDGYLAGSDAEADESHRAVETEEMLLLVMANLNPAFRPFLFLFDDQKLEEETVYNPAMECLRDHLKTLPAFGPGGLNLWDLLRAPALASPDSLAGQLRWIRENWGEYLSPFMSRLLTSLDVIAEEEKPNWQGAPGPTAVYEYGSRDVEYEKFSQDLEWMPRTVLMAKSTLVWLSQLTKKYGREITRLDQIPDEELDELSSRGFTGLWLIGLWERSNASRLIKQWKGNPEAAASAYSLYDYDIAGELGGWGALCNLRERCAKRGIRLGSDMVPNHTGIDSRWIMEHPDRFLQLDYPPYPQYTYNSGNLSSNPDIVVQIEDHYYDNSDCAVTFHHYDRRTNRHRYIYHGNDGTSMPWNDTAQIDFLNPEAREAVIATIVGVCKQFQIVRFDAAMTLAKRHIQRLWYPEPGRGGDIASRAEHAITAEEFNCRIPNEFWREVVDRCTAEAPNTLLLAEAFWMMEGYFVRTLGMHRVYNSAFMNMLKKEENAKYRQTIKNTLEFDPEVLKRFVNFMNNPDEETAVAQFGKDDKYFGVCTLMVTQPGLPMFGHGQIEGFEEKYGMEYRRAYRDEVPDQGLIARHEREIFPLMRKRYLFSGSRFFNLYDFWVEGGGVNENVYAYSNRDESGAERTLVLFNNFWEQSAGWVNTGAANIPQKDGSTKRDNLAVSLGVRNDETHFLLLHEQRSNLWFLRSSKELHERGMFFMLGGYQAQVYDEMKEVDDPTLKTWARLAAELNGKGVASPEEALEDTLLGELYWRFEEAFTAVGSGQWKVDSKSGKTVTAFVELAKTYLTAAPSWPPFPRADRHEPVPTAEIVGRFEELLGVGSFGNEVSAESGVDSRFPIPDSPLFTGFALFTLLRGVAGKDACGKGAVLLAEHWHLDRKLRELYEKSGVETAQAARLVKLCKAVVRRVYGEEVSRESRVGSRGQCESPSNYRGISRKSDKLSEQKPIPDSRFATPDRESPASSLATQITPYSLLLANYDAPDFREALGVNVWDSVVWFNKELFEETLKYAALFVSPFAGKKRVKEFVKAFEKAEEKSGYRLDKLLDALAATANGSVKKGAATGKAPG